MARVFTALSMSLDGFIAAPEDDVNRIFDWYFSGDTDYAMPSGRRVLKVPSASADLVRERFESPGAVIAGRRLFDVVAGWNGKHPADVPVFVVTHDVPEEWRGVTTPFTFVMDGVESALTRAREAAEGKDVLVSGGASIVRQSLESGLLEEIEIDIVPVLLGDGISLFRHLTREPIELESIGVVDAPGVTHLRFRVAR